MASLAQPTWTELQSLDENVIAAMNIIKGQMNGDEFIWDHEEVDEDGVIRIGIWKSTLEERKKQNDGRVLPSADGDHARAARAQNLTPRR